MFTNEAPSESSGAVRLLHALADRDLAVYHMLYSDVGWLNATGEYFWRKILFWIFALQVFEFPLSGRRFAVVVRCSGLGTSSMSKISAVESARRKSDGSVNGWESTLMQEGFSVMTLRQRLDVLPLLVVLCSMFGLSWGRCLLGVLS